MQRISKEGEVVMKKPNIVYILADDLGYGDLSCYGPSMVKTDHIDSLAKEGIRFVDAHSPSAVCTPTRYSVLTGRYNWRSRLKSGVLWGFSEPLIEDDRLTVPTYLKSLGYQTACIGKWHLGLGWVKDEKGAVDYTERLTAGPTTVGFDYFYGISASLDMPPYCFIENDQAVDIPSEEKTDIDFSQRGRQGLMTPGWKDEQVNKIFTERACSYIKQAVKRSDQPFYLYFPVTGPHTPWKPQKKFRGKSGIGPRGDMILEFDWTISQIEQTLKNLNIWEDTLLIVTSDNGPHPHPEEMTKHNHWPAGIHRGQKADIWDGGHRIPFIATWPKLIEANQVSEELICLTDLLATVADITGQDLPTDTAEDTLSILPVLKGDPSLRHATVHHSITGMFSLRKGKWKLIVGQGSGGFRSDQLDRSKIGIPSQGEYKPGEAPGQLYNMKDDPGEENNLYLQYPQIVSELTEQLIEIINSGLRFSNYQKSSTLTKE